MESSKYPRTCHFPFSPGASNDDKILFDWHELLEKPVVITEKLDGENTCLKSAGVFARSHSAPTRNPWAQNMWPIWERLRYDLDELEIFGENLYGVHSIEYQALPGYFFVFGIRQGDTWFSWQAVRETCFLLDLQSVPVFAEGQFNEEELQQLIHRVMQLGSAFKGLCEGVVVR
ncbi:MAG: RNA ligase family protein, partial [Saprospiraceae bacterium]|nr:RNA ligase family protein [Saprospiraceae bacterium]